MYSDSFSIKKFEVNNFAKLSGDTNKIHIDDIEGYNSIYGYNIINGVYIVIKFLEKIKFNKTNFNINVNFKEGFEYSSKIQIKKG